MPFSKEVKQLEQGKEVTTPPATMDSNLSGDKAKEQGQADGDSQRKANESDIVYPTGLKLALLMASIFTSMFLVSLDRLIIATAIPQITDEFDSAGDIGWYGTAYLLTSCAFQLVFGKLYTVFSIKSVFIISILLFEAGSALCGAAPNSVAFILGRSIAGLGSGGVMSGILVIIVFAVPLQKRPKYQGLFGAIFGISSIAGPIVGGAFTTNVTWRWCFYLNLPIGALVLLFIFFLLKIPDRPNTNIPLKEKLRKLNFLGLLALLPGIVCLCLALQWGGITYAWSDRRVIALLVLAFVLLIAFCLIQVWKPDQATVPPRIFVQRSIASGFWVSSCLGAHMNVYMYFLPLWFQAIDGLSAVESGNRILAMLLSVVVASLSNGILVSKVGYYTPSLIIGVCLTAVGAGVLTTLEVSNSEARWIAGQIVYGLGIGFASQAPNMAAQTVLSREDVSIGASLGFFSQMLFGAVFTSVGQNVLDGQLSKRLAGIPGITPRLIQTTGATKILDLVPAQYHAAALVAYDDSLRVCFQVALIMACLAIFGALGMEWRSVKKNLPSKNPDNERAAEEGKGEKVPSKIEGDASETEKAVRESSETNKREDADTLS